MLSNEVNRADERASNGVPAFRINTIKAPGLGPKVRWLTACHSIEGLAMAKSSAFCSLSVQLFQDSTNFALRRWEAVRRPLWVVQRAALRCRIELRMGADKDDGNVEEAASQH